MCALRMVNHQIPGTNHAMTLFCQDSVLEITRYINFLLDCTQPYHLGSLGDDDGDGNENGKKEIGLIRKTTTYTFCCCRTSSSLLHSRFLCRHAEERCVTTLKTAV